MASSVIIKWAKEGGGDRDQARLIDLAHPIRKGKVSDEVFQAAKEGMLLGIRNVRNLLLGGNLEEGVEKKLPIGVGNLETKTPGGEQPNAPGGHRRPSLGRHRRNAVKGDAPALEDLLVAGAAGDASASAPKAAPAPTPAPAPASASAQPEAASAEPDAEELKRMAQEGKTLTIAQRRRIYGG